MNSRSEKLNGRGGSQSGFTLLEMVVVLSIMVILSTMAFVTYQASAPPGAVNAARNELHGLLRFARNQAIMSGSNSMLIINYDSSDPDKFLRYAGVIVEEEYNSTIWKAAHSGVYLPKGVYFVPQAVAALTDGFSFDAEWPLAGGDGDVRSQYKCSKAGSSFDAIGGVEYPVLDTIELDDETEGERDWVGYQFGPDGSVKGVGFDACLADDGSKSNHIVVGMARYQAGGGLLFENSEQARGFIIRLNGVSYAVDDPDAL
jgi:prepilin-type N-terminal cleavage/methylation domain-containing protein